MKGDNSIISNFKFLISNFKGQSLIEVIIGVGVAVMLAISLITTSLITQRTARSARNNTQATKLAQEYVEQIRAYRDRKGFSLLVENTDCLIIIRPGNDPAGWSLDPCDPVIPPEKRGEKTILNGINFYRALTVDMDNSSIPPIKGTVTATVDWDEPSGLKTVTSQTILTKWEGLP